MPKTGTDACATFARCYFFLGLRYTFVVIAGVSVDAYDVTRIDEKRDIHFSACNERGEFCAARDRVAFYGRRASFTSRSTFTGILIVIGFSS